MPPTSNAEEAEVKWLYEWVKVAQSCPTLCDPMDYTVHGILQARILEWVAFFFSRGSSQPRDWTQFSHIAGRFFTSWATREAQAVLWRRAKPSRTNTQKRCLLHYRGMEWISRKSRATWSNRKIWPWSTKQSRSKANRVLPRECTGHSKHLFQQHKRRLYIWTSPDGQYQNQIDDILCSQKWRSSIQSAKARPGADCGSDYELLTAKLRLK